MTPARALAAHSAAKAKINAAAAAASAAASEAQVAAAAANAAAADASRRVVAARVSDLPTPAQEPFGGLTLEDIREFFSGTGTIERISCSPFPMRGPVLLVDLLLQYQDPAAAVAAVSAYHGSSMTGGPRCSLALSIFATDEILVEPGDPFSWDATNGGQSQLQGAIAGYPMSFQEPDMQDTLGAGFAAVRSGGNGETGTRKVVLAHITNLARPDLAPLGGLSVDGLHAVFSQCGTVEKIACTATPRTGLPVQFIDAMVQFSTESEASSAVQAFDGTSLSNDNFHLAQMKFSKHTELRTLGNSERARVYVTTPQTPATATNGALNQNLLYDIVPQAMKRPLGDEVLGAGQYLLESASKRARGHDNFGSDLMGETRRVVLAHITELPDPEVPPLGGLAVDDVHAVFVRFGFVEKVVCVYFPKTGPPLDWVDAMVQFRNPSDAAAALQSLEGSSLFGDGFCRMQCKWSKHPELTKQGEGDCHRDYTQGSGGGNVPHFVPPPLPPPQLPQLQTLSPMHLDQRGAAGRGQPGDPTAVLAAFNLAEEIAEPDILFNLFSLYGYVEIVKVVFKRPRDTALVQFAEPAFVDLACDRLQGAVLAGRPMDVRRSRQQSIRCTEKDQSSIERTTRSYSPNDQFWSRKEYQKIFDNAASPSRTLFVKNIAPQLNEHDLLPLFRQHGHVQDFAFLPCKAPLRFKTAVVQMAEVRDSMTCVALVQRERFPREEGGEDMRLMVSFSKKDEMPRNVVRGLA